VNKGEVAEVLAERTELSKAAASRALDGILDTLTEVMAERDEVSFAGWGKFSAQRRKGRVAHDPRNPQRTIHVAPAYVPKFKAGAALRRELAGQSSEPESGRASSEPQSGKRQSGKAQAGEPQSGAVPSERAATPQTGAATATEADADQNGHGGQDSPPGAWRPLAQRRT